MARNIEITLYKFDELEERIQQRVIDGWRANDQFPWGDEWTDSLKAFERIAPLTIRDWQVGYPGTFVSFYMEEDIADLSGAEAHAWLIQDGWDALANPGERKSCPFTGYIGDESLLDAIRTALGNEPTLCPSLRDIFEEALNDWAKAFEDDLDYWNSEEAIREDIEANDYEFHANGTLA